MDEDREYLPTSENLYSTEQKTPSEQYRNNYAEIIWQKWDFEKEDWVDLEKDGKRKPKKD